jgi:hypothetical protein
MDSGGTASPAGVAGDGAGGRGSVFRGDDAPKLLAALKEMKEGLDLVTGKVKALTRKVLPLSPPPRELPHLSRFLAR